MIRILKKGILLVFLLHSFLPSHAQYVTLEGRQFKDEHDSDFYPVVCNYNVNYFYTSDTAAYDTASLFLTPDSDGWEIQCDGTSVCDSQFYHNFQQIKHMGFNTIRFFGAGPVYDCGIILPEDSCGFKVEATRRIAPWGNPDPKHKHLYPLYSPYNSDTVARRMFHLIDRTLIQANRAGLKVILLAAGMKGRFYPELDIQYYPEWLSALADHIAHESPQAVRDAIMAYDLLNEPYCSDQIGWPWPGGTQHSKQAVCNRVANWYDALKSVDPDHLVTMGAGSPSEVAEYDLNVMKLDFASPHYYARRFAYEPDNVKVPGTCYSSDSISKKLDAMIKRYHGTVYWLSKNSVMPFIIGETGFAALDSVQPLPPNDTIPMGVDGDTLEQKKYAEITLKITKDCLGSGYSWWKYQDSYWGINDFEDYLGLLRRGICYTPCNALEKPVVAAFQHFNAAASPGVNIPPVNYYNPFNHPENNVNTIHGNVKDDNGHPIMDAVVTGSTYLCYNFDQGDNVYSTHSTFTKNNGSFSIIPYDYLYPPDPNTIESLWISAPGSIRAYRNDSNSVYPPVTDSENFVLTQKRWNYDETLQDTIIQSDEPVSLQGWNSISFSNVSLETTSDVFIRARSNIELSDEFDTFKQVGDVLLECAPTFPICTNFDPIYKQSVLLSPEQIAMEKASEVELSFQLAHSPFDFTLYPNPANDILTVNVLQPEDHTGDLNVIIFNSLGMKVFTMATKETTFDIGITGFRKGVYFMSVSTNKDIKTKSFISK